MNEPISVVTKSGMEVVISVRQQLIMLHSEDHSMQWPLDGTGIQMTPPLPGFDYCKIGFWYAPQGYQSFLFQRKETYTIYRFFKSYNFPMQLPNGLTEADLVRIV